MRKVKKVAKTTYKVISYAILLVFFGSWIPWHRGVSHTPVKIEDDGARSAALSELWAATEKAHLSGVILVKQDDKIVFSQATSSLSMSSPIFIGSLTKQFTAARIHELIDQGLLSLDDDLCRHLKDFCDGDKKNITLRQVLSHSSGLPNSPYTSLVLFRVIHDLFTTRSIAYISNTQNIVLDSKPGTEFQYSNLGFDVLARLIEVKTGRSYADEMGDFFARNHLQNTFVKTAIPTPEVATRFNVRVLGGPRLFSVNVPADIFAFENTYGAGAVLSSANDMISWLEVQRESGNAKKLLAEIPSRKDSISSEKSENQFYFSGWVIEPLKNLVWHNGAIPGYRAGAFVNPTTGMKAVFIFNTMRFSKDEEKVIIAWQNMFTGREYVLPKL